MAPFLQVHPLRTAIKIADMFLRVANEVRTRLRFDDVNYPCPVRRNADLFDLIALVSLYVFSLIAKRRR